MFNLFDMAKMNFCSLIVCLVVFCVHISIVANLVTQMVNSCREFELKTILPFMVSNLIGHVSQHIVNELCAQMVVLF